MATRKRVAAKTPETPPEVETPSSGKLVPLGQVGFLTQKTLSEIETEFGFPSGQLAAAHRTVMLYNLIMNSYEFARGIELENDAVQRTALANAHQSIRQYFETIAQPETSE